MHSFEMATSTTVCVSFMGLHRNLTDEAIQIIIQNKNMPLKKCKNINKDTEKYAELKRVLGRAKEIKGYNKCVTDG